MFEGMDNYQTIFWVCAIAGTAAFAIKTATSLLIGADHDLDGGIGEVHEVAHDGIESSDAAFQLISITSLTGFFMMFGWIGLAMYEQGNILIAFLSAFVAGLLTMYITAFIFRAAAKLAGGGARFDIKDSIGKTANVYQRIGSGGRGRIQISLADVTHEIDAISEDGADIDSFSSVEIVRAVDGNTVSVKKI